MEQRQVFHSSDTVRLHEAEMQRLAEEICTKCNKLGQIDSEQWEAIDKKVTLSSVKWGIGIMIVIFLAVLGTYWQATLSLSEKLDRLTKDVAELTWNVNYLKQRTR